MRAKTSSSLRAPLCLYRVTEEFFALGDLERAAGMQLSPFCDRYKDTDLAKSQMGFLNFVCTPFFAAAERALPGLQFLERLDANMKSKSVFFSDLPTH